MIKNDGDFDRYSIEDYAGPRQMAQWSDAEVSLRASRYESNRASAIEQVELCDVILIGLRAEAVRRSMTRDKYGRWRVEAATGQSPET